MGVIQSTIVSPFGKTMKKDVSILMLGLKGAGKSTIIHKLKLGQLVRTQLAEGEFQTVHKESQNPTTQNLTISSH